MRMRIGFFLAFVACVCGACSSVGAVGEDGPQNPIDLQLFNPFASSWLISERRLDASTFELSLRAKHFRKGGDGEVIQVIRQRADQLQREAGASSYRLLDFSEGVESSSGWAYRVSRVTVVLVASP
jgi:hypothetical protein